MPTATVSVESLCNRLQRSRLLKPPQVKAVYTHWRKQSPPGSPGDADRFARWLATSHHLTNYQAQQIFVGHTDHFFLNNFQYKLLDLVGKGRMAGIFKAMHVLGHIVAIKVMPAVKAQNPKVLARFKREARMGVRLQHTNIVRTYQLGISANRPYIVMEYLEGETLEEVLKRRKKMPYGEAVRLIHQALWGLQHIHDEGLVHRDLKPGNLMLVPVRPPGTPDNTLLATLKILDIGLGRVLFEDGDDDVPAELRLTTDGTMLGTMDYISPEQARDSHNVDVRADIYSLGSVLYHLIAGQVMFPEANPVMQMIRLMSEVPKPLRQFDASVPDALQAVINKLLAKDPKQRYAEPAHAAQALAPFVHQAKQLLPEAKPLGESFVKWVEAQTPGDTGVAPVLVDRWYYSHQNKRMGPVSSAKLDELAIAGLLGPDDTLWLDGDDPTYGIHARAAIDFASLPKKGSTPTQNRSSTPTIAEAGFDPHSGRIHDPAKFRQWQKDQKLRRDQDPSNGGTPTIQEAYFKARTELSTWIDLERNRPLIHTGDMEAIRQDAGLRRFMVSQKRFGDEMLHKLWQHVEFMVENRRKYYYALGR